MIEIKTIEDAVSVLGGRSAVAQLTGRTPDAVTMWKNRGRIPFILSPLLDPALERKGAIARRSLYTRDRLAPQRRPSRVGG